MRPETIQLETLRQKIEDAEFEAGDRTDYISYGKPNAAQAKQAKELIETLKSQSKTSRLELKQLIGTVRAQNPQAFEEWINYHVDLLQKIIDEKTQAAITPRKNVAKETMQSWEKVRAGEQEYVNINWHFLKDYKEGVRTITGRSIKKNTTTESKAWWQIWK